MVIGEGFATKLFLVHLRHVSPPAVATVLDLWGVQIYEYLGVTQGLPPIAIYVVPLDHCHGFLSKEVNGKLFIYLRRSQTLLVMETI